MFSGVVVFSAAWIFPTSGSEHPRFDVISCVDSKNIGSCSVEIVYQSRSDIGTVRGIVCRSQNSIWIARGISFDGVDRFRNSLRFYFEVKILFLSSF